MDVESVNTTFLECIPRDFAREHLIIAQNLNDQGELLLHVADRTDPAAIYNVGVHLNIGIDAIVNDEQIIGHLIDDAYRQYAKDHASSMHALLPDDDVSMSSEQVGALLEQADRDLLSTQGKGPIIRLVDAFLFESLGHLASDIHIQPLADRTIVRYRIDGVLHKVHELPVKLTASVLSRIKVMGKMDIAEQRIPQDGRATVTISDRKIDLRISTIPTSYGERAVIRLLDNTQHLSGFDQLGMSSDTASKFYERSCRSNGIILVTGPTGSGKTTTLYSTLRKVATDALNLMTIEDPIEYELSTAGVAISQAQVNLKKGITFATGLRHILRQDPDIIMVGEIRDTETAQMAIQSSLTGHLVFSTLHTNDAPSAVTRLVDLGIEPYLVNASLSAVLAQRLVRLTHQDCNGKGCSSCFQSGFRNRTGLFELMIVDDLIRDIILSSASAAAIRNAAIKGGMRTLHEHGEQLLKLGVTTLTEVERVVQIV